MHLLKRIPLNRNIVLMAKSQKKEDIERVEKEWGSVDVAVLKSESFIEKNMKPILIGLGVVVAAICIYLAANQFYFKPEENKAQAALFKGQAYFSAGMDSLTLYGDGRDFGGMISFINEYGSTKAGNLAKAYAGISFAHLGKYDEALKYLKDFKADDELIAYSVEGAIGDCYANQNKLDDAASQFEKAAKGADNALLSPIYYKKAGIIYRQMKQYDKEIEVFTKIKTNYMSSPEAVEADKYIGEANLLKK